MRVFYLYLYSLAAVGSRMEKRVLIHNFSYLLVIFTKMSPLSWVLNFGTPEFVCYLYFLNRHVDFPFLDVVEKIYISFDISEFSFDLSSTFYDNCILHWKCFINSYTCFLKDPTSFVE